MNILVAGGAGYVGGYVTDLLVEQGEYNVRVFDNLLYKSNYSKSVDFVFGDIRDKIKLKTQLDWADVVIWMAALVGDGACSINPKITKEINYDSVDFLAKNFNGRIIFFSTCSVYGAQDGLLNEKSATNPLSVYASTKLEAEAALNKNNAIIFRLGTLFGVGDLYSRIRMDLVVNVLTAKAFIDKKLTVFGGEQYRPLLHVKDAARAIMISIKSKNTGIFNLHSENIKILDLANKVKSHFEDIVLETVDVKFQDTRNYKADGTKLRNELNFETKYSIDFGIEEIKKILKEKRIKNINDPRYTNQKYLEMFKDYLEFKNETSII